MRDRDRPPPKPPQCLQSPGLSSPKGGRTLIAEDVVEQAEHRKRLCDPEGYRPACCPGCGHRRVTSMTIEAGGEPMGPGSRCGWCATCVPDVRRAFRCCRRLWPGTYGTTGRRCKRIRSGERRAGRRCRRVRSGGGERGWPAPPPRWWRCCAPRTPPRWNSWPCRSGSARHAASWSLPIKSGSSRRRRRPWARWLRCCIGSAPGCVSSNSGHIGGTGEVWHRRSKSHQKRPPGFDSPGPWTHRTAKKSRCGGSACWAR